MMKAMTALKAGALTAASLLAVLAGGCADKSFALVTVQSTGGQFNDVAALVVEVRNGQYMDLLTYEPPNKQGLVRFDETTALTFSVGYRSSSHKGTLEVAVTPLDGAFKKAGYGVGSAPIVADGVTPVTVRVTPGALPPSGPDGGGGVEAGPAADAGPPCDPVNPTSCNGGTCYLSCAPGQPVAGMCTMAGTKNPGELCARNEDCLPGSQCFAFSCGAGKEAVKTCLRFCKDSSVCGAGQCTTPLPCDDKPTAFKACSQACNPVGPATTGCAAGLHCFVFADEIPDCDCAGATHVKSEGDACTTSEECKPGNICVSMAGTKVCRPVCRLDAMPATCAAGKTCTKLVDPDYKTYGACL
jgi:hypothetical protein